MPSKTSIKKGKLPMRPILSDIHTLSQHINTLAQTPELYQPAFCPACLSEHIRCHGVYYRKPDRLNRGDDSENDIAIPRHQCADCLRTSSTLPECIAPRRWYPWVIQQWCLWLSLNGWSIHQLSLFFPMSRSTISRWVNWLKDSFHEHHRTLCAEHSNMGYYSSQTSFWCHWLDSKHLSHAMVLLNKRGIVVP
jgi:transposase-like protein